MHFFSDLLTPRHARVDNILTKSDGVLTLSNSVPGKPSSSADVKIQQNAAIFDFHQKLLVNWYKIVI